MKTLEWDSELTALGVFVRHAEPEPGQICWRLREASVQQISGHEGMVQYSVVDETGVPLPDIDVLLAWPDWCAIDVTGPQGRVDLELFAHYDPGVSKGPYWASVVDTPADEVYGLGLPWGRPVVVSLVFQRERN